MKESLIDMLLAYKKSNSKADFDKLPAEAQKEIQEFLDKYPKSKGVSSKVIQSILKKANVSDEDMQKFYDYFTKQVKDVFTAWGMEDLVQELTIKAKSKS
jgi:hypothetical protein